MTCAEKREICFWGAGCLQQGKVGMGKKKEKQGRRGSAKWSYINFCRWNHRRTTSVGDSVGHSDGESVTSLYGDPGLNPSVILLVKSPAKTSTSAHRPFFKILNIPSVIPLVYTDQISSPVYTDEITDGKYSVGKYDRKLPTEVFRSY